MTGDARPTTQNARQPLLPGANRFASARAANAQSRPPSIGSSNTMRSPPNT